MTRHNAAPWQELPADEAVTWTPASPPQAVEGPLALELFRDRLLALELAPDQVALHVVDGRIRRAYLDGHHQLPIGSATDGQAPEGWLVFLRPDVPIAWRWQDDAVLHVDQHARLPLRGACAVHVSDPVRFHDAVLAGLDDLPLPRLAAVLDTLVRGQLESRLQGVGGREGLDPLRAKVILEGLEPAALDDDLDALGLSCGYLAVAVPVASENDAPTPDQARPACYDDVF
jgi:hypothetical protein